MGYRHAGSRYHVILRLALPSRYNRNQGSPSEVWSRGGVFKGLLAAQHNVVRSTQQGTAGSFGSSGSDVTWARSGYSAVCSGSPSIFFEPATRKHGCLWEQQSVPVLFRAGLSFSNLVHVQLSGPSNLVHTRPFASQAEASATLVEPALHGMHEKTRTADHSLCFNGFVQKINAILLLEDWESSLEQLNVHLYTKLVIEVIRRQPDANAALAFFQWTKRQHGFQHTGRTYKVMLQKLMIRQDHQTRNLDSFHMIMNESLRNGWSPGVAIHTSLIAAYCKLGKVDEAFEHFNEMVSNGCAPNVFTYSSLIGGLIKVGRIDSAVYLLYEMEENGCDPNVVTYTVLIHGLVKDQRVEQAWQTFERMKKQGLSPDLITYSLLIEGLSGKKRLGEISKLLDEMKKTACIPNVFIYATVIKLFVRAGKLQQAWDLFCELKENGLKPNLFVYTPLVKSFGEAGNWKQAQELIEDMKLNSCTPDAVTYGALIDGLVRACKWEDCVKVLDQMEANGCQPNELTYTLLLDGLIKAREADLAEALFKRMVASGCSTTMFTEDMLRINVAKIRLQLDSKF